MNTFPAEHSSFRALLQKIGVLFSMQMIALVAGAFFQIILTRFIGAESSGIFTSANAYALLLLTCIDYGFELRTPIAVAAAPHLALQSLIEAQRVKNFLWCCVVFCVFIFLIGTVVTADNIVRTLSADRVWVLCIFVLWVLARSVVMTYSSVLRGLQHLAPIARVENSITVLTYSGILGCLFFVSLPVSVIVFALTTAEVVKIALLQRSLSVVSAPVQWHKLWSFVWEFVWKSDERRIILQTLVSGQWLFVMTQILTIAESRAGIFVLGALSTAAETGYFAAALRFVMVLRVLPGVVFTTLLPTFSVDSSGVRLHEQQLWKTLASAVILGCIVSAGLTWGAELCIHLAYGTAFTDAIAVLRVLAWLFFMQLLTNIMEAWFLAQHKHTFVNAALLSVLAALAMSSFGMCATFGVQCVNAVFAAWLSLAGQLFLCVIYGWKIIQMRILARNTP